jgi:hypothetical protein
MHWRAVQDVVAEQIAGLMRAAVTVHRSLRRNWLYHTRQMIDEVFLSILMHEALQLIRMSGFRVTFPWCEVRHLLSPSAHSH